MPSDLDHPTLPHPRNVRRRPANAPAPLNWNRLLLLFVLLTGYSTFALAFHLPPWSTLDHFRHRNDKVLKHRPAFKNVERYSPEHRYRPAASPVIKRVGKDGKVKHHGDYHLP